MQNTISTIFWYLISLLPLLPLLVLIAIFKSPWFKGYMGEVRVNFSLWLWLNNKKYRLLKNVTLPTTNGSTQIDHILISQYGIFVIETKNMTGWIYGSEKQRQWTQKIYKHTNTFQNPLHQNYKHTKTLATLLSIVPEKLFSVIVFVGDGEFKTKMPDNVIYMGDLIRFIKSKQDPILSIAEVRQILAHIKQGRLRPSIKVHQKHIQHVRDIKKTNPTKQS